MRHTRSYVTRLAFLLLVGLVGCGSKAKVEVVDLDKVLAIFDETASQQRDADAAAEPAADEPLPEDAPVSEMIGDMNPRPQENPEAVEEFLTLFQDNLNAAKLIPSTITVAMNEQGKVVGFRDTNGDSKHTPGETEYFTIETDTAGQRLIATQQVAGDTYHRDHSYSNRHYHGGSGFFWGYMVGSMGHRQNAYYRGTGLARPNYGAMQMNQRGYHSSAVSRARSASRSSSARSRGGSGGFRGGK